MSLLLQAPQKGRVALHAKLRRKSEPAGRRTRYVESKVDQAIPARRCRGGTIGPRLLSPYSGPRISWMTRALAEFQLD